MKQKGFAPILILVLIALAIVGYFGYKNYWERTSFFSQQTESFTLGNFAVQLPRSKIATPEEYITYQRALFDAGSEDSRKAYPYEPPPKAELDAFETVQQSVPADQAECAKTQGASWLRLLPPTRLRTKPHIGVYPAYPLIITSWNTKTLSVTDSNIAQEISLIVNNLSQLSQYEDMTVLESRVLSFINADKMPKLGVLEFVNLDIFIPGGCAGGVGGVPTFIKHVATDKFDRVFFARVSTLGQEGVFTEPFVRKLIVQKNNDILLISDIQENPLIYQPPPEGTLVCPFDGTNVAFQCKLNQYAEKHMDEAGEQKWVRDMLDAISYKK